MEERVPVFHFHFAVMLEKERKHKERVGPLWRTCSLVSGDLETGVGILRRSAYLSPTEG